MKVKAIFNWKVIGVVLSILLLGLAFWMVDVDKLLAVLASIKPLPVLLVALLNFGIVAVKSYRWQLVINAAKRIRFMTSFLASLVGFMANTFLPARAGELVRVIILGKKENISAATVLGTLALDQVLEAVGMLVLLIALPFLGKMPDWLQTTTLIFAIVLAGVLLLFVLLLLSKSVAWTRFLPLPARWRETIGSVFHHVRDGLQSLKRPSVVALVILVSIAGWLIQAYMVLLCLQSINLELTFTDSVFVLMAINLAILVPSAPSSLGTFEFAAVVALGFLGVDASAALSFALIYHFVQLIPVTLAGILVLPALKIGWRDLRTRPGGSSAEAKGEAMTRGAIL